MMTMGLSTVAIGLLPTYASIGIAAPALLALCRFGQGLGLGGEWGGAVLLAVENAPPGKRAGTACFRSSVRRSGSSFRGAFSCCCPSPDGRAVLIIGWRIPFLASAVLVLVGLYVRLTITGDAVFRAAMTR